MKDCGSKEEEEEKILGFSFSWFLPPKGCLFLIHRLILERDLVAADALTRKMPDFVNFFVDTYGFFFLFDFNSKSKKLRVKSKTNKNTKV